MKRIPLVLASLACSANLFAGSKDKADDKGCCPREQEGCCAMELANGKMGCTLQADRPVVDLCHGFEFGVSALYWKPYVDGTEYGYTDYGVAGSLTTAPVNGTLRTPDMDMDWGFKVSLGYLFCQDAWQADLEFTFFQGSGSDNFSNSTASWDQYIVPNATVTGLSILNGSNVTSFPDGGSNISTDLYRLSLMLSRGTYASRFLSITPGFALTTTWLDIKQTNTFTDTNHVNFYEIRKSNTWHIGPTGSLDTRLAFGRTGWSLTGEWDMTLGFGNTDVSQNTFFSSNSATNSVYMENDSITFSPETHVLLGLQYDRDYFDATQHLTLMAGLDTYVMWQGFRTIRTMNGATTLPIQFDQKDGNVFATVGLTIAMNYQF